MDPIGDRRSELPAGEQSCGCCGARSALAALFCARCGTRLPQAIAAAEYKQVTVLFADVVHSMDIAATVGAECMCEIIAGLVDPGAGDEVTLGVALLHRRTIAEYERGEQLLTKAGDRNRRGRGRSRPRAIGAGAHRRSSDGARHLAVATPRPAGAWPKPLTSGDISLGRGRCHDDGTMMPHERGSRATLLEM